MGMISVPYKSPPVKVAFLIGNGFDLGLGLKTSYRDFIKFYLDEDISSDLNEVQTEIIKKFKETIQQDLDSWGNAELEFGKVSFSALSDVLDVESVFSLCADDFQRNLCKYLRLQEQYFNNNYILNSFTSIFRDSLWNVIKRAPSIENILSATEHTATVSVNFINFNYTSTFDHLLNLTPAEKMYGINKFEENLICSLNEVIHVHGSLQRDDEMLFGVNDVNQIKDSTLFDMSELYGYGIKPMMANHITNASYALAKSIVEDSHVIILFGLSFGATDRVWWETIIGKVIRGTVDLLLCPFTAEPKNLTSLSQKIQVKKQEIVKLLRFTHYWNETDLMSRLIQQVGFLDLYGPYPDPENGESYYCDPLHLNYFKRHCIQHSN